MHQSTNGVGTLPSPPPRARRPPRSSLGLDLYLWLVYKLHRLTAPERLLLRRLYRQFAARPDRVDRTAIKNFRKDLIRAGALWKTRDRQKRGDNACFEQRPDREGGRKRRTALVMGWVRWCDLPRSQRRGGSGGGPDPPIRTRETPYQTSRGPADPPDPPDTTRPPYSGPTEAAERLGLPSARCEAVAAAHGGRQAA